MAHLWEYGFLVLRSKEGGEYLNMVYSCLPSKAILMVGLWYGWRSGLKQSPSDTALGTGQWSQGQEGYEKNRSCECWNCQHSPMMVKVGGLLYRCICLPQMTGFFLLSRLVGTELDIICFINQNMHFSPLISMRKLLTTAYNIVQN